MAKKSTTEIHVRITKGKGKNKDTIAHAADNVEEIIKFLKKHA